MNSAEEMTVRQYARLDKYKEIMPDIEVKFNKLNLTEYEKIISEILIQDNGQTTRQDNVIQIAANIFKLLNSKDETEKEKGEKQRVKLKELPGVIADSDILLGYLKSLQPEKTVINSILVPTPPTKKQAEALSPLQSKKTVIESILRYRVLSLKVDEILNGIEEMKIAFNKTTAIVVDDRVSKIKSKLRKNFYDIYGSKSCAGDHRTMKNGLENGLEKKILLIDELQKELDSKPHRNDARTEEEELLIDKLQEKLDLAKKNRKTLELKLASFEAFDVSQAKDSDQLDGLEPPCPSSVFDFENYFEKVYVQESIRAEMEKEPRENQATPVPKVSPPVKKSWFPWTRRGGKGKAKYTRKPRRSKNAKGTRKKVRGGKLYPAKTYKKGAKRMAKYTRQKGKTKTKKANRR